MQIILTTADDWYDGPLNGLGKIGDDPIYYYYMYDSNKGRIFAIFLLTFDQSEKFLYWRNEFLDYVGDNLQIPSIPPRIRTDPEYFYSRYNLIAESLKPSDDQIIGLIIESDPRVKWEI